MKKIACLLGLLSGLAYALDPVAPPLAPARVFYADAKVSFTLPEGWTFDPAFPDKPLFSRETQEGGLVQITCDLSDPLPQERLQEDVALDVLRDYARTEVTRRAPKARVLAAENRTVAGRNAIEVTWEEPQIGDALQEQIIFFFVENRFVALSLKAGKNSFPWQVPDFQKWVGDVQVLSRRESGALTAPAHGGLWIHEAAGARVPFPEEWLIGVADDRQVGAAITNGEQHSEITVTADVTIRGGEIDDKTKAGARADAARKDWTVAGESDEPFHSYPAYRIRFEGYRDNRYVRGEDIWVASPKARWLISLEGDGSLSHRLEDDYRKILAGIEFQ